jgi:hypothetical protein
MPLQKATPMKDDRSSPFRDAHTDIETAHGVPQTEQTRSAAYRLAFADDDFLCAMNCARCGCNWNC